MVISTNANEALRLARQISVGGIVVHVAEGSGDEHHQVPVGIRCVCYALSHA